MQYANLADIIDGFECASQWRFVRKANNDWSFIGLNDQEQVVLEIEHFHYKQVQGLLGEVNEHTEIVVIEEPQRLIRRDNLYKVLHSALHHLTSECDGKDDAIASLKRLMDEISGK